MSDSSAQYTNDYGLSPEVFGRASGSSNGNIRLADQDRHLDPDMSDTLAELNAQFVRENPSPAKRRSTYTGASDAERKLLSRERMRKAADQENSTERTKNESKRKPHDYTAKVDALLDSENDLDAPFPVQPPPLSQNQFIKPFIESMDALTDLVPCSVCQEQRPRQDMADYEEIPNKDLLAAPDSAPACDTVDGYYLERSGIHAPSDGSDPTTYTVCILCQDALAKRKIPARAIANGLAFGSVPDCLKDLTITERILINPIRTKLWLVILKQVVGPGSGQRAIKGHSISLPTNTQAVVNTVLPLDPDTLRDELNVVLARDHEPNEDELKRLFTVRVSRVQAALEYLITTRQGTSSAYAECHIDRERLRKLPTDGIPQQVLDTMSRLDPEAFDSTYAGYTTDTLQSVEPDRIPPSDASTTPILMDHSARIDHDMSSIGLDDRNGTAIQSLLSWRKPNGSATLVLPHGARPVQEYREERFYSDSFAHLFVNCQAVPLADRPTPLSIDDFFMHCFLHVDPRWRKDISFMFVALNNTMRREAMQNVFLKLRPSTLAACNQQFGQITSERLTAIANNMKDPVNYPVSAETSKIGRFLRERVETTQSSVELTNGNKKMLRRWLKNMMVAYGLPAFWATANPNDLSSQWFLKLAVMDEAEILQAVDGMANITAFMQGQFVANNATRAAQFFHAICQSFFQTLINTLGDVKAYFGVVEAQGRGTLHMHMLIWIKGYHTVSQIDEKLKDAAFRERIKDYVSALVSTSMPTPLPADEDGTVPEDTPQTLAAIADVKRQMPKDPTSMTPAELYAHQKELVSGLLMHSKQHTESCFKKGSDTCRHNFPFALVPETTISDEGVLELKRDDPWIVQHCPAFVQALNSNTHMQHLFLGKDARALPMYMCDYATKMTELEREAFELTAILVKEAEDASRTGQAVINDRHVKNVLLKFSMAGMRQMQISAQETMTLLLGYHAHYKSHEYQYIAMQAFVSEANKVWSAVHEGQDKDPANEDEDEMAQEADEDDAPRRLVLDEQQLLGHPKARTSLVVFDYTCRPHQLDHLNLYQFGVCDQRYIQSRSQVREQP